MVSASSARAYCSLALGNLPKDQDDRHVKLPLPVGLGLTNCPAVVGPRLPCPHAASGRRGDRGGGGHPGPGDGHGLHSPDWTDGSYSLDGWVGSRERPCQACTGSAVQVKAVKAVVLRSIEALHSFRLKLCSVKYLVHCSTVQCSSVPVLQSSAVWFRVQCCASP